MPSINSPQGAPGTNVPPADEFYDPRVLTNPWPDPRWALHNMAAGDGQATQSPNDDLSNKGDSSPRTGPPDFWSKVDALESELGLTKKKMMEMYSELKELKKSIRHRMDELEEVIEHRVPNQREFEQEARARYRAMQEAMAINPHLYGMEASRQGLAPMPGVMVNLINQNPFTEQP